MRSDANRPLVITQNVAQQRLVQGGWEKVQANGGAPGVDAVSINRFAAAEGNNLYKLWNRMSSGSYLPGPVRAVEIPKDHGAGVRVLGVPNAADRIAQTAAAMLLEEKLERFSERRGVRFPRLLNRLFSQITMNWRGRPLTSHQIIVDLIGATNTATGLTVRAELDTGTS